VQSLSQARLSALAGVLTIPMSDYPLTTSEVDLTVGLPRDVVPLGLFGGDAARSVFARSDGIAALIGIALACFGFRTGRTRPLGSLATAGLWFVSREAFVLAAAALFVTGATFLASRFLRGNALLGAGAAMLLVALFGARATLGGSVVEDTKSALFVQAPSLPQPDTSPRYGAPGSAIDVKVGSTPVSLSTPTSERYVQTSRQLVTSPSFSCSFSAPYASSSPPVARG
jgi:hypothetical protein